MKYGDKKAFRAFAGGKKKWQHMEKIARRDRQTESSIRKEEV